MPRICDLFTVLLPSNQLIYRYLANSMRSSFSYYFSGNNDLSDYQNIQISGTDILQKLKQIQKKFQGKIFKWGDPALFQ